MIDVHARKTEESHEEKKKQTKKNSLHEKFHKAPADAGIDDGLDFVVGAVGEVGQGPAGVCQQVRVAAEEKPGQHRQAGRHLDTQGGAQTWNSYGDSKYLTGSVQIRSLEETQFFSFFGEVWNGQTFAKTEILCGKYLTSIKNFY